MSEPAASATPPRVAAITMVYNEALFLPLWLRYYGAAVGIENCYVLDHGSDDGSIAANAGGWNHIRLPRTPFDDVHRASLASHFASGLLGFFDAALYSDCDEFLIPDPARYRGLRDYIARMEQPVARALGVDLVQILGAEGAFDAGRGVFEQRRHGRLSPSWSKPLITRQPIDWAGGFHTCRGAPLADPDLILFHLKLLDFDACLRRLQLTREHLQWSERAVTYGHGAHQRLPDGPLAQRFRRAQHSYLKKYFAEWDFEAVRSHHRRQDLKEFGETLRNHLLRVPERFAGLL